MALVHERTAQIRVLVVDDEPLARRNVIVLLRGDPDIGSIEECGSGAEAIEVIRSWKPALVLGADLPPTIIFVTAYDKYALRAFEAGALDYLLKPFDDARFGRALQRAKDKLAHYAPLQPRPARRLVVRSPGQLLFLDVSEIDWIEAASYYACLHVGGDTHIIRRTLSELERDLSEARFIRIHRSTIVNLDRIHGLELQSGGEYEVVLKSKVRLRLSRRFRKQLQERMESMSMRD
jgi:two-component system LytT family response regulator